MQAGPRRLSTTHDIAVIVLDVPLSLTSYGALPSLGLADRLGKGAEHHDSVGYGVQELIPSPGGKVALPRRLSGCDAQERDRSDENRLAA